ncbi:hypothetical protein IAU59_001990 [Kwoniella sp. CBS 9459]
MSNRYPDFLGNNPARPHTTVPGRWILELPSCDSESISNERKPIHIRRFRAILSSASNDNEAGPGPSKSARRDNADGTDVLEAAWRSIAEQPASNPTTAPRPSERSDPSLAQPSSVITPELLEEGQERVLWVFSTNEENINLVDGLQEIEPRIPPIHTPDLLICSNHGRNPSCFASHADDHDHHRQHSRSCEIVLDPSGQARRSLKLLGAALAERMAWKAGWRLCLQPGLKGAIAPVMTTLRPVSTTRLMLSLTPSTRLSGSTGESLEPLLLSPLHLPALRVSDLTPSSLQDGRLSTSFDQSLGAAWKNGRQEACTRARLLGEKHAEWSVYWVPLISDQDHLSPKQAGKLSPRQLCERWRQGSGLLTVWPTHLAEPYFSGNAVSQSKPVSLSHGQDATKPSDLLDIAGGVFDFLSNYREPEVVEEVEDDPEPVEEDVTMDGESNIGPISITDGLDTGNNRSPQSDIDDLFSAHSDSPTNDVPDTVVNPPPPSISNDNNNEPDPIDERMVEALDYDAAPAPVRRDRRSEAEEKPEQREENMVTEDDFAFFDSPTDQVDAPHTIDLLNNIGIADGDGPVTDEGMEIDLDEIFGGIPNGSSSGIQVDSVLPLATESQLVEPTAESTADAPTAGVESQKKLDTQPSGTASDSQQAPSVTALSSKEASKNKDITPPQRTQMPPSPALSFHKRSLSTTDLIPNSFSPLPLLSIQSTPKFDYPLPSPAPTPSSLREDLVERLKPPVSKNATYADVWELDSEPSEMDVEEEYTGPPTPESAYSDESETEIHPIEKKGGEDDDCEFGGVKCITTDWLQLIYLPEKARTIARTWDSAWNATPLSSGLQGDDPVPETGSAVALKGIDCVRLIKDLISNRALGRICSSRTQENEGQSRSLVCDTRSLLDKGMLLSELNEDKPTSLAQPMIHAGYSDSVIKLSISSLHYWTEIGLQPQGGPQNVEAVVVCIDDTATKDAGGRLILGMKRAWESLRLGKHAISELGGNSRGIITVPSSSPSTGIPEAVADLLNQISSNTVIYILLTNLASSIPSVIRGIYSLALSPSPSAVIRLIPDHALSQDVYREIAAGVYDAFQLPIRPISHTAMDPNLDTNPDQGRVVPAHAFTLARQDLPRPEFSMSWPLKSYDVLNTQRSVHGLYTIVEDCDVMIACVMDDLGETLDVTIWHEVGKLESKSRVKKVFEWCKERAEEWTIQWKGSVTCAGPITLNDIRAWSHILDNLSIPLTLLVVDGSSHRSDPSTDQIPRPRGLANIPAATMNDSNSALIDLSLTSQYTALSARLPLAMQASTKKEGPNADQADIIYPQACFLLTTSDETGHGSLSTVYSVMNHSKGSRSGIKPKEQHQKLGEELYRLNCLIRKRYGTEGMLGMLDMAQRGLEGLAQASSDRRTPPLTLANRRRDLPVKPSNAFAKYEKKLGEITRERDKRLQALNYKDEEEVERENKRRKKEIDDRTNQLWEKLGIPKNAGVDQRELDGTAALMRRLARNAGPTTLSKQAPPPKPSWLRDAPMSVQDILEDYTRQQEKLYGPMPSAEDESRYDNFRLSDYTNGDSLPLNLPPGPPRPYLSEGNPYPVQPFVPQLLLDDYGRPYHVPINDISSANPRHYGQPPLKHGFTHGSFYEPHPPDSAAQSEVHWTTGHRFLPDATSTPTKDGMWTRQADGPSTFAPRSILRSRTGRRPFIQPSDDDPPFSLEQHQSLPFDPRRQDDPGSSFETPDTFRPDPLQYQQRPIAAQGVRFVSSSPERWQYSPARSSSSSLHRQVPPAVGTGRCPTTPRLMVARVPRSQVQLAPPSDAFRMQTSERSNLRGHEPVNGQNQGRHPGQMNGFSMVYDAPQSHPSPAAYRSSDIPHGHTISADSAADKLVEAHREILEFKKEKKRERARARAEAEKWKEQTVVERLEKMAEDEDEINLLRPEIVGQDEWPLPQDHASPLDHKQVRKAPGELSTRSSSEYSDTSSSASSSTSCNSDSQDGSYHPTERNSHSRSSRSLNSHEDVIPHAPASNLRSAKRRSRKRGHIKHATSHARRGTKRTPSYGSSSDESDSDVSEDQENIYVASAADVRPLNTEEYEDDLSMASDTDGDSNCDTDSSSDEEATELYEEPSKPTKRLSDIAASVVIPPHLLNTPHRNRKRPNKVSKKGKMEKVRSRPDLRQRQVNQSYSGMMRDLNPKQKGSRYLKHPKGGLAPSSPVPTEASGPGEDIDTFSEVDEAEYMDEHREGEDEHGDDMDVDIEDDEVQVEDMVKPAPTPLKITKLKRFPKRWRDLPVIREDVEPEEESIRERSAQRKTYRGQAVSLHQFKLADNQQQVAREEKDKGGTASTDMLMQKEAVTLEVNEMEGFFSKDGGELGFRIWRDDY